MNESSERKTSHDRGAHPAVRVLIAKPGLDGHDRGVKVILRALWEAGMEVIYTGMRVTPEAIALAAAQEDVQAIGVSNHSGAHVTLFREIIDRLEAEGVSPRDVVVFCGGAIPPQDVEVLREIGYRGVFPPGSSLEEIVRFLQEEVSARDA